MKKLDKFILQSFIGPFILTFLVVVFILLMQHMLKYFDDIIGKGLDWSTIGQLLFYFAIFMTPVGMPLAVLLSTLITFGNLGEHFELTAIKASGVSMTRILLPIFLFVLFLTGIAFYANNYLVPNAALEAYSLLYDIKQKKPALEIREGAFYTGIPDVSIKVDKKFPDDEAALKKVIIYDHRKNDGNKEVTIADSGRMFTFFNEQYLKLELFNGYYYAEGASTEKEMTGQSKMGAGKETVSRTRFVKSQVVFDLSSFNLNRTEKKWFQGDRIMRNMDQLQVDIDSVNDLVLNQKLNYYNSRSNYFVYFLRNEKLELTPELVLYKAYQDSLSKITNEDRMARDSVSFSSAPSAGAWDQAAITKKGRKQPTFKQFKRHRKAIGKTELVAPKITKKKLERRKLLMDEDTTRVAKNQQLNLDSLLGLPATREQIQSAANYARQTKTQITNANESIKNHSMSSMGFEIQWHKILSNSLACIVMFLIGAPLGAIIKRGGLGVPFLVSILFFIVFYLLTMQGEKWAKNGAFSAGIGVWMADAILLVIGLFFLRQARIDARLFDTDFYSVVLDKLKTRLRGTK
jgi:lipopolysaccharide export system permease protein